MRNGRWLRLLAYVSGSVNQELLLRNEYLVAENHMLSVLTRQRTADEKHQQETESQRQAQ